MRPRRVNPWLFASTPRSISRIRLDFPLLPGTLLSYLLHTGAYAEHERGGLAPARAIVVRWEGSGWAQAIMREATAIGPRLNGGRGLDAQACVELRAAGITVLM